MTEYVDSASDERTVNNVMRHEYRVLTEGEKSQMKLLKDIGLEFISAVTNAIPDTREGALAKTKMEEAVMWAVKGLTS
jgi:hypothetical protein